MATEAQRRANAKYAKNNVVRKNLAFYPADKDILDWLSTKESMQGYIKQLIREDMQRNS